MDRASVIAQLQSQIDAIGSSPSADGAQQISRNGRKRNLCYDKPLEAAPREEEPEKSGGAAFKKIIDILNAGDKSELAIRERLRQKGFEHDAIDEAVAKAIRYGFIDDMRYADVLVRSRLSQGKGSAGIERELEAQNIDVFALEGWPQAYGIDHDSEVERAIACLNRKPPRSKNLRESAFRRLVQRGFSTSVSASAARMWIEGQ